VEHDRQEGDGEGLDDELEQAVPPAWGEPDQQEVMRKGKR
jgi:hypothetical protein